MYIVRAESVDGTVGFISIDDDEALEEFIQRLVEHPHTHRYAVIREDELKYVEVQPAWTDDEFAQAARERAAEIDEALKTDPDALKALPGGEIDGFKFVNASGQELPEEVMKALAQALEETGQLVRDENGKLVQGTIADEGALNAIDLRVENGELVRTGPVLDFSKKKLN